VKKDIIGKHLKNNKIMIVISKVANKKLLKGHRYEVQNLWNAGNNQRWVEGKLQLVGFGRYSVDSFTDSSGNPIAKVNYTSTQPQVERFIKFEDCKEGEILVCNSDHYKTLAKGSMYKIEKLEKTESEKNGWGGRSWTHTETTIKFEGIKRKLKFNGWAFRKLTTEESRNISLGSILTGEEPLIVKTTDIRKIDIVVNKEKALMEVISKTLLDENRHHLSIIDWTCQKTGEKFRIKPEDFKDLLDMKLSDILAKIENK
jgi:hypothetical protein